MRINVADILTREVGASIGFDIQGERPDLSDLELAADITGHLKLVRTEFGLISSGSASGAVTLDCHRCSEPYTHSANIKLAGEFSDRPNPDQWPIGEDNYIDLDPLVRQELIVSQPIQQICKQDCLGLCTVCGQVQNQAHDHPEDQPISNIRIVKGTK